MTCSREIQEYANILFERSIDELENKKVKFILEENADVLDVFSVLLELVLYGINILTKDQYKLFYLENTFDDYYFVINACIKSCGFKMEIVEHVVDLEGSNVNLYRDRADYYCEIVKSPPYYFCVDGWYVLNYRIIENKKFQKNNRNLKDFKAFFFNRSKKIFLIYFDFAITENLTNLCR